MDNYVLKYIPVMTDEGKMAHFGEQTAEDEDFDLSVIEEKKREEYLALLEHLSKDNALNDALDILINQGSKPPKFEDFKKRLVRTIANTKLNLQGIHKKHQESTTTLIKKDADLMRQSMEKFVLSEKYKQHLQEIITEQLLNQKPHADPFSALCDAGDIVDFIENLSPLMKRAASNFYQEAQPIKGRNAKKLDEKERLLKQDFANKLAKGVHYWLNVKVSSTHDTELPTAFAQFLSFCCEKAGFGKTSSKSDQAQNAVAYLKTLIPRQDSKK